jgi:hypothetical protein
MYVTHKREGIIGGCATNMLKYTRHKTAVVSEDRENVHTHTHTHTHIVAVDLRRQKKPTSAWMRRSKQESTL